MRGEELASVGNQSTMAGIFRGPGGDDSAWVDDSSTGKDEEASGLMQFVGTRAAGQMISSATLMLRAPTTKVQGCGLINSPEALSSQRFAVPHQMGRPRN